MILDDENILIDNLKNNYIIHVDQLYKNMIDGSFLEFIEDALKILNKHKLTQYGAWKYRRGIFGFFSDKDPYKIPLINIIYFYHYKPLIYFRNAAESYDLKKYYNITEKDYEKIINKIKLQYGDKVEYREGTIV